MISAKPKEAKMILLLGILGLILSFISALYLQLPTFILILGYRWSHNYPQKRWVLRIFALVIFTAFISLSPQLWMLITLSIPFFILLGILTI